MNIIQKAQKIQELRNQIKLLKEVLEAGEIELLQAMKEQQTNSFSSNGIIVTVAKRNTFIFDDKKVMNAVKQAGMEKLYIIPKLDKQRFTIFAKEYLKKNGKSFEGVELSQSEYLSIRKDKKINVN